MDYVTRYYKNLSEKLTERLQLLESILPGVRPTGSRLANTQLDMEDIGQQLADFANSRSQTDVARAAQREIDRRKNTIPGMPNLSANIKFSRGTREGIPFTDEEADEFGLSPEERRQAQRSTSLTPQSDIYSFMNLSQQERERIAYGLPTKVLRGMEEEQYRRSRSATNYGRGSNKLGADRVAGLNTISRALEDRKGPLGGKAGADTYFERIQRNAGMGPSVDSALAGKNLAELGAMQEAGHRVAKREFSTGKIIGNAGLTPETYGAVRAIETARDEALERKVRDTQDLMASREEASKKMYGEQWMRYM